MRAEANGRRQRRGQESKDSTWKPDMVVKRRCYNLEV